MATGTIVRSRIDQDTKDRAAEALAKVTIPEALDYPR